MISCKDFEKKQLVFVFSNDGDKLSFSNDNMLVKDKEDKIKLQITCYRLFAVYIVGNCSITSVLIENAKKFNFRIILMNQSFRVIEVIGYQKEGNTLLKRKQYNYVSLDNAKMIIQNKMLNQLLLLKSIREKDVDMHKDIKLLESYIGSLDSAKNIYEIMAFEGNASRVFFSNYFKEFNWKGRRPRTRMDYINSLLDLGYSLLFSFIDSILACFGFDTYVGILHRQFYMRKSLTCDIIEPFRCIVDKTIRKYINLKKFKEEDYIFKNNEYRLSYPRRSDYIETFLKEILNYKDDIFVTIRIYYQRFMRDAPTERYQMFLME